MGLDSTQNQVCVTQSCVKAASTALSYLNRDVDPCEDFYEFACGNYIKETVIPEDEPCAHAFLAVANSMENQLKLLFDEFSANASKPHQIAYKLYSLCMNTSKIEEQDLKNAHQLLKKLGGWPIVEGNKWNESKFEWTQLLIKLRQNGLDHTHFIKMEVVPDDKNITNLFYRLVKGKFNLKVVEAYKIYIKELALAFGANKTLVQNETNSLVKFESDLSSICVIPEDLRNHSSLYHPMSISTLQNNFPEINWLEYIKGIINTPNIQITEDEVVIVRIPEFFSNLLDLIKTTPKRIIANYILSKTVLSIVPYLTQSLRDNERNYFKVVGGVLDRKPRWKECINIVTNSINLPISSMYIKKYFNKDIKDQAEQLVFKVKDKFIKLLETVSWLDATTRNHALKKAAAIATHIGYPSELLNDDKISEYYSKMNINFDSYLSAILSVSLFNDNRDFEKLHGKFNKSDWPQHAIVTEINAFYSPEENSICFPAGILQGAFFDSNRPNYMNYGALGYVIGHEITHGFDDEGRQFDKDGNLNDWWSQNTTDMFKEKAECIVRQYENYVYPEIGKKINGINTQGENIADNVGIKVSYLAYRNWVKENGVESKLPGLDYTPNQMFWITAAQLWCSKYRSEEMLNMILSDNHSPPRYRVIGSLSNSVYFLNDFQCDYKSKMNAKNKCVICPFIKISTINMIVSYSTTHGTVRKSKVTTLLENRLQCGNLISFLIIVALFMGIIVLLREHGYTSEVCLTTACIESASNVLKYMDTSVDPCNNFYKFACGNYIKDTVIPEDKSYQNHFSAVVDKVFEQLQLIFEEHFIVKSKPFKLLKKVYDLCMDTNAIEDKGMERAKELLNSLGGWPIMLGSKWNQTNFNWTRLVYKLRQQGYKYNHFFTINVEADDRNSTQRILTLDQSVGKVRDFYHHKHRNNVSTELHNYLLAVAKAFGANTTVADKDIKDLIQFEIKLSKIRVPEQGRRNGSAMYNKMTIRELHYRFPGVNWMEYITNMVNLPKLNFSFKDTIVVRVPTYFSALETLLKITPKRLVQANYILTKIVTWLIPYLTEELRSIQWQYSKFFTTVLNEETRWKECIRVVLRNTGLPLYSLYIQKHFNHNIQNRVELLVADIKNQFKNTIQTVDWLDNSTKNNALEKLESLLIQIGYPQELLNENVVENFYSNLSITTTSYVDAMLQTNLFHQNLKYQDLQKTLHKGDWTEYAPPTMVNAYYVRSENSIKIPAALLHDIFFDPNRPHYMNYAILGNIIGHELIHGFDDRGSQYDKDGNLNDWWSTQSRREFINRIGCIINQYNNYSQLNTSTNGVLTQAENTADNGGIKQSYYAYHNWTKHHRPEPKLPGLRYTPQQMFWISAAQLWCYKARVDDRKGSTKIDAHSLPEYRVIGTFSNSVNFSNDFNCPVGSPMNPENKCIICELSKLTFGNNLNKRLLLLSVLGIISAIALAIALVIVISIAKKEPKICVTPPCIQAASVILHNLDPSVNPCDNFYQFACGNLIKNTATPEDKTGVSPFATVAENILNQIKAIFEEPMPANASRPHVMLRKVYDLCSNSTANDNDGIKNANQFFKQLGGWPLLEGNGWNQSRFECDVAVILGANNYTASKEIQDVLEFKVKLAKILQETRNISKSTNFRTIKELQKDFQNINWLQFINKVLGVPGVNVTESEKVLLRVPQYLKDLLALLEKTPKRVLANYMMAEHADYIIPYLSEQLKIRRASYYKLLNADCSSKSITTTCMSISYLSVGLQIDHLYVTKYFNKTVKDQAEQLVTDIRKQFVESLKKVDWLDNETRAQAIEKVLAMKQHVGYPSELLESKNVDSYYDKLKINSTSYLAAILSARKFQQDVDYSRLRQPRNKTEWISHVTPLTVNAFYSLTENSINFPAGILQGIFYNKDRPSFMNYGILGFIIGHEITHGFDNRGRLIDKDGKLNNWWSNNTKISFMNKSQCVIDQYNEYTYKQFNLSINGTVTQGESIADNGAVKQSYNAYNTWTKKNGPEPQLPGLNYTSKQLFWISSAQLWCSKYSNDYLKRILKEDPHPPPEFRVIGAFSNSESFVKDFNCPLESYMNRKNKCSIW
ncbi:hypothetical protein FQR65_LT02587 [Abscondita terminalis]|nr:hypothetical protein FQR65_LT02587 [Abscondita terminalis]